MRFGVRALTLFVVASLLGGITPAYADTRSTAIWEKLQSSNPQGYVLLVLVGHFVNISAVTGVGLESGEGVVVRADKNGEIKVVGFTPIP